MAERRFVLVQALGPRVSWPTLRRKALEALESAMEDRIRGGKMNRRQKSGVMELADEDLANIVAKHLDGMVDSQTDPTPWKARTIDEAEAGPLLNGADPPPVAQSRASSSSKSPPARTKESAKVAGSDGDNKAKESAKVAGSDGDNKAGRSRSGKRRSPSARDDRKRHQSPDRKRERSRSRSPDRKRERSRSRKRERSRSRRRQSPSPRRKSKRSRSRRSHKRRSRSRRR